MANVDAALVFPDGRVMPVRRDALLQFSSVARTAQGEDFGGGLEIPILIKADPVYFARVAAWCEARLNKLPFAKVPLAELKSKTLEELVDPDDREFIGDMSPQDRFKVMMVANFLDVDALFYAMLVFTAFEIKAKTADDAYAFYDIQKAPEELKAIRERNLWVFDYPADVAAA